MLLLIAILLCFVPSGCDRDEPAATDTARLEPSAEPTETEEVAQFTPSPEPEILINLSRGEMVARVQRRLKDLGYLHYRPTGYFLDMTQSALRAFQEDNGNLEVDGNAGQETLDELFNQPYPNRRKTSAIPGQEPPDAREPGEFGNVLLWESVNQLLPLEAEFVILDLNSDIMLRARRTGGNNHMHAEPATAEDAENLTAMFSKVITGEKRPCLLRFEGQVIAASIYGAPHGDDTIPDNDFSGSVCIYFSGCTDDSFGMPDWEHENNIQKAAGLIKE